MAMNSKAVISKEVFGPNDERMLAAMQVKRRGKKRIPFLATGGPGEYVTYICVSVTNRKPTQGFVTKVKQFDGTAGFVKRTTWGLEQLRQVNGIGAEQDCPELDLLFDSAQDQWVASSTSEKNTFLQVLHNTCQRYRTNGMPTFANVPARLLSGVSILGSAADSMSSAVAYASQALSERGERLGEAEDRTAEMAQSAQQFADTAHKLAEKYKC
ncbi:syntaxin-binding protein 6-like [Petromyzon marinus]|uniref:Syntaxin-binding protein 6-like n=2 Tax=Petromyzon marinus TaxID=7757 RepID=A0AAJ7X4V7_PETMA|nr:syntaxin-binding protein 6-like [Petromyzon marinus]